MKPQGRVRCLSQTFLAPCIQWCMPQPRPEVSEGRPAETRGCRGLVPNRDPVLLTRRSSQGAKPPGRPMVILAVGSSSLCLHVRRRPAQGRPPGAWGRVGSVAVVYRPAQVLLGSSGR